MSFGEKKPLIARYALLISFLVVGLTFVLGMEYYSSTEVLSDVDLVKLAQVSECHLIEIKDRVRSESIRQFMVYEINEYCKHVTHQGPQHASQIKAIQAL